MTRIFIVLAALTGMALLGSFALGLVQLADSPSGMRTASLSLHIISGLFTAVLVLLVHCLVFTYFLGTGRWIREVAAAYYVPEQESTKPAQQLKRWAYPSAMMAMLITIATVGSGAAVHTNPQSWLGLTHPILAVLTLFANAWAFHRQWHALRRNQLLLERIMAVVQARQAASRDQASPAALS